MRTERAMLSGEIIETKEMVVNGVNVGVIRGYIATWEPDARPGIYGVKDRIMRGAYAASIQEHKARNNRQVRLKNQHYQVIGGFPIENVREDNKGLFAEGHINLNMQLGRETYALAQQRVLVDMSVGHIVDQEEIKDGYRNILKAQLIEGSIVDEPANRGAIITEVKGGIKSDLPVLSDASYKWQEDEARGRVLEMKYSQGDASAAFVEGLLIADLIEGKLQVVPVALKAAASKVNSREGQLTVERYFAKMGEKSPFESKLFYTLDDVKSLGKAELKDLLTNSGVFSHGAARAIVARMVDESKPDDGLSTLLEKIKLTTNNLKNK